ncbi:MAG TPA: type II toxin-antitoxin system VapC family toxin [Anaerolineae bacterium]|nr:type II toxin-antitoxin system VapC family toxin [Anaerolineae bacterium]
MSVRYLLDTNVLSEPLRPAPQPKVIERLRRHQDELATASIVWHELWFGCQRLPDSAKRQAIEDYLTQVIAPSLPILPYDERAAQWHAAERARLTRAGKTPAFADGQIAAIARTNDLILVTFNRTDYADFQDLTFEDWH